MLVASTQVQMVAWEKSQLLFSFDYLQMSLDLFLHGELL